MEQYRINIFADLRTYNNHVFSSDKILTGKEFRRMKRKMQKSR